MKKKINTQFKGVLGAGLIALAGSATAAQPSNDELLKQLKALQATVEALQKQVKDQGDALDKAK